MLKTVSRRIKLQVYLIVKHMEPLQRHRDLLIASMTEHRSTTMHDATQTTIGLISISTDTILMMIDSKTTRRLVSPGKETADIIPSQTTVASVA